MRARFRILLLAALGCAAPPATPDTGSEPAPCSVDPDWSATLAPLADGDFPQYRLTPLHVGAAAPGATLTADLVPTWQTEPFGIGDYSASKSSPVVADGRVFAGFDDGYLRAFDAEDGALLWELRTRQSDIEDGKPADSSTHQGIHGTPAVADGVVYVGAYDGWLYAADAATGALRWEAALGDSIGASPLVHDDTIWVSVEYDAPDGKVFVLDAVEGCVLRSTDFLGEMPHASATIDPERGWSFVGANNGRFQAWDYINDVVIWDYWMGENLSQNDTSLGDIKSTAAVVGDVVYSTSWDGRLHAIDIPTGETRFTVASNAIIMSSPSVSDGRVLFGSHDGFIRAVAAATEPNAGELLWQTHAGNQVTSSATIVPGTGLAAIGSRADELLLLDVATGEVRYREDVGSHVTSVPTIVGSSLYLTDMAGIVRRYDSPGAAR